jgi:hypothetical protein
MRLQLVAQGRSDPGKEFIHAERFRHVIVGAKVKGLHLARLITAARKSASPASGRKKTSISYHPLADLGGEHPMRCTPF